VKCNASHASKKEGDQYFGRAVRIAVRISDPDKSRDLGLVDVKQNKHKTCAKQKKKSRNN